jgi:hypothetical protein
VLFWLLLTITIITIIHCQIKSANFCATYCTFSKAISLGHEWYQMIDEYMLFIQLIKALINFSLFRIRFNSFLVFLRLNVSVNYTLILKVHVIFAKIAIHLIIFDNERVVILFKSDLKRKIFPSFDSFAKSFLFPFHWIRFDSN